MKFKLSRTQWENIGKKGGWIKTSKIGKDDIQLILSHTKEIWVLLDKLQGTYRFLPERKRLMEFQRGIETVLPYAEASSDSVIKVSENDQTMPLDSVQSAPSSQPKFEEKDKKKTHKKEKCKKEEMIDTFNEFKNKGMGSLNEKLESKKE